MCDTESGGKMEGPNKKKHIARARRRHWKGKLVRGIQPKSCRM